MRTSDTVPIKSDLVYGNAIRALANQRQMEIGQLVRNAMDATYGDDLKPYIEFFAAQGVQTFSQSDKEVSESTEQDNTKSHQTRRSKRATSETTHEPA